MMPFLRAREISLAVVVLVMFLIAATEGGISYSVGRGPLRELEPLHLPAILAVLYVARIVFLVLLVVLWVINHRRALYHTVIVANAFFTAKLLLNTVALIGVLGGFRQAA